MTIVGYLLALGESPERRARHNRSHGDAIQQMREMGVSRKDRAAILQGGEQLKQHLYNELGARNGQSLLERAYDSPVAPSCGFHDAYFERLEKAAGPDPTE